jgi:DNA-3-methyladenine glycosylase
MMFKDGASMKTLSYEFYNHTSLQVAPKLLGKTLINMQNGKRLSGKIVEVEAYMGPDDKAAHSYGNKRTKRNEVMFGPPGHAYVYMIYGMYYCMNVITSPEDVPHGVLIRAVEPLEGLEYMSLNRYKLPLEDLTPSKLRNLTRGPGRLCSAMNIDRSLNGASLSGPQVYIEEPTVHEEFTIATSPRINISYAQEAAAYPWRFYIEGNRYVSV